MLKNMGFKVGISQAFENKATKKYITSGSCISYLLIDGRPIHPQELHEC